MKKLLVFAMLFLSALSFAAPIGVAQLKGTYSFQISGTTNAGGYYVGNVWHYVNGSCPAGKNCMTQAFPKLTVGTISFNGAGKAEFMSIAVYNPSGEPITGSPVKGSIWPYSVSGVTGLLGTQGNGAVLTLGSYNASGIATVVLMLTDDKVPEPGVATLQ